MKNTRQIGAWLVMMTTAIVSVVARAEPNHAGDSPQLDSKKAFSLNARAIATELERCPCWTDFKEDEIEFRAGITRLYSGLVAKYTKSEIRDGIEAYLASPRYDLFRDNDAQAKVFAFLRVVFSIPDEWIANTGPKRIATFGNPLRDGLVDLLWPFSLGADKKLRLTGVPLADCGGQRLNLLAEFDALAVRYPFRNIGPSEDGHFSRSGETRSATGIAPPSTEP